MKTVNPLLLFVWVFLVSCSGGRTTETVLVEYLSPEESHPKWTELFTDRYEITPLETTSECLVGQIDKIRKYKGDYYILASNGSTLFHFDSNGKFRSVLDRQGQGPGEYLRIEDFDVCETEGKTEVWISDNVSLKIYDATDFSFLRKIDFPFVIHKFKRMPNSHILIVTGQNDRILTLTDETGKVLSEYLENEVPYVMFRPVQFVAYGSEYLFQLGISNAFVAFDPQTETFRTGRYTNAEHYLSREQLIEAYQAYGFDFIREANKGSYINNMVTLGNTLWIQTHRNGQNFLTKIDGSRSLSTECAYGTILASVMSAESDDSILLYITPDQFSENEKGLSDKFGNKLDPDMDDNPYLLEFL